MATDTNVSSLSSGAWGASRTSRGSCWLETCICLACLVLCPAIPSTPSSSSDREPRASNFGVRKAVQADQQTSGMILPQVHPRKPCYNQDFPAHDALIRSKCLIERLIRFVGATGDAYRQLARKATLSTHRARDCPFQNLSCTRAPNRRPVRTVSQASVAPVAPIV